MIITFSSDVEHSKNFLLVVRNFLFFTEIDDSLHFRFGESIIMFLKLMRRRMRKAELIHDELLILVGQDFGVAFFCHARARLRHSYILGNRQLPQ